MKPLEFTIKKKDLFEIAFFSHNSTAFMLKYQFKMEFLSEKPWKKILNQWDFNLCEENDEKKKTLKCDTDLLSKEVCDFKRRREKHQKKEN